MAIMILVKIWHSDSSRGKFDRVHMYVHTDKHKLLVSRVCIVHAYMCLCDQLYTMSLQTEGYTYVHKYCLVH